MVKRYAFTLIELIFAIILIAITVLTLPRMMGVISQGIDENIIQEAIFAAATELNQATTGKWDDRTLQNANELAKVIDTNQSCENNTSSPRYRLRPGHIAQTLHRKCLDNNATTAVNFNTLGLSLEARTASGASLFLNTTSAKGYKKSYTKDVTISYTPAFNGTNADLKMITVTIKENNTTVTSLYAFSANIGEADYFKRMYP